MSRRNMSYSPWPVRCHPHADKTFCTIVYTTTQIYDSVQIRPPDVRYASAPCLVNAPCLFKHAWHLRSCLDADQAQYNFPVKLSAQGAETHGSGRGPLLIYWTSSKFPVRISRPQQDVRLGKSHPFIPPCHPRPSRTKDAKSSPHSLLFPKYTRDQPRLVPFIPSRPSFTLVYQDLLLPNSYLTSPYL